MIAKIKNIRCFAGEGAAVIGGAFSLLGAAGGAAASAGLTARAREENYKYNEMSAQNADARTRALYKDLYSPQAQKQMLEDAGLSPSLMYGMNGAGGAGASTPHGAQGAGVNQQAVPANFSQMVSDALTAAQIKNVNADTEGKEIENEIKEETGKDTAKANIKNLLAAAGLDEAKTENEYLDYTYNSIRNAIQAETSEEQIEIIQYESEKWYWEAYKTKFEAYSAEHKEAYDERAWRKELQKLDNDIRIQIVTVAEKYAGIKLTNAQIAKWEEELEIEWEKLDVSKFTAKAQANWWRDQARQKLLEIKKDIIIAKWQTNAQVESAMINACGDIIGDLIGGYSKIATFGKKNKTTRKWRETHGTQEKGWWNEDVKTETYE